MLKPVYALVGDDLFLQLEKIAELLRSGPPDLQRIDLEGETAVLADVLDELRSFAMFSSAKAVVLRDAEPFISRFRESLEQYVARPAPGSTLILRVASLPANQRIYKLICASGQVIDCKPPKGAAVVRWIVDRAKQAYKLSIATPAAELLQDLVGNDLGRLDNELAKLSLQVQGQVDATIISRTVSFQREQEMWDMTNELGAGNVAAAVDRWRHLVQLDSSSEYRAVMWLTIWLEKVRKALVLRRQGVRDSDIARELKIWPYDQQPAFFRTAAALGDAGAAQLITLLASLDYRSKTGLGPMTDNVERFLLAVGRTLCADPK